MSEGEKQMDICQSKYRVKYESFLEFPEKILTEICDYIEINPDKSVLKEAVADINPSRAYSYKNNKMLNIFALDNKEKLSKYDYQLTTAKN